MSRSTSAPMAGTRSAMWKSSSTRAEAMSPRPPTSARSVSVTISTGAGSGVDSARSEAHLARRFVSTAWHAATRYRMKTRLSVSSSSSVYQKVRSRDLRRKSATRVVLPKPASATT